MRPAFPYLIALAVLACGTDATDPEAAGISRIRQLTDSYHDVNVANSAGYTAWSPDPTVAGATCPVSSEGKMGYHRVNLTLRGSAADPAAADAEIDLTKPEMMIYEKTAAGAMSLVGVEYIVFKAAWERVNGAGAAPPEILGHQLILSNHTFPGNAAGLDHYELHVWAWKDNPNGMFFPYNPNVTC